MALMALECAYHGTRHSAEGVAHTHMVRKCCHVGCRVEGLRGGLVAATEDGRFWFCEQHACTSPSPLVKVMLDPSQHDGAPSGG